MPGRLSSERHRESSEHRGKSRGQFDCVHGRSVANLSAAPAGCRKKLRSCGLFAPVHCHGRPLSEASLAGAHEAAGIRSIKCCGSVEYALHFRPYWLQLGQSLKSWIGMFSGPAETLRQRKTLQSPSHPRLFQAAAVPSAGIVRAALHSATCCRFKRIR